MVKIEFEKQFGKGTDPWYAKAERWAKKQKFPISFLALGLIAYLKKVWINTKIKNEMASVDAQIKQLHEDWDEEDEDWEDQSWNWQTGNQAGGHGGHGGNWESSNSTEWQYSAVEASSRLSLRPCEAKLAVRGNLVAQF